MTTPSQDALTATEQTQAVEREAAVPGGEWPELHGTDTLSSAIRGWNYDMGVKLTETEICSLARDLARFGRPSVEQELIAALKLVQDDVRGKTQSCGIVPNTTMHVIHRALDRAATPAHRPPQPEREAAVPGGEDTFAAGARAMQEAAEVAALACERVPTNVRNRGYNDGCRDVAEAIANLPLPAHRPPQPGVVTEELRWQHVVRGTFYTEIGRGELQGYGYFGEGAELVCYRGDDGRFWFRPAREFDDGRFVASPSPGATAAASPAAETAPDAGLVEALRELTPALETLRDRGWWHQREPARTILDFLSRAGERHAD